MLGVGRDDLVSGTELESRRNDVARVGRRAGERDAVRRRADQGCQLLADRGAQCEHALEPRLSASPLALVEAQALLQRSEGGT